MKLAPTSEAAAVLCAITVTSVATMWEEKEEEETERGVKSSACPSLLHSGCCCQIYGTKSKHTWMRLSCSLCEHLELLLPTARGRAAVWFVVCVCTHEYDLVCFGLLIKRGLCFVGGATQSGSFVHFTLPSTSASTSPCHSPLHRCAGWTAEPLQSQQKLRQRLTPKPNWRHNRKGISKPLGGIKSPNKVTFTSTFSLFSCSHWRRNHCADTSLPRLLSNWF